MPKWPSRGSLRCSTRRSSTLTVCAELLQARTEIFSQLPGMVDFLAEMPELDMALFTNKKSKSTPETEQDRARVRPSDSGRASRIGRKPACTTP